MSTTRGAKASASRCGRRQVRQAGRPGAAPSSEPPIYRRRGDEHRHRRGSGPGFRFAAPGQWCGFQGRAGLRRCVTVGAGAGPPEVVSPAPASVTAGCRRGAVGYGIDPVTLTGTPANRRGRDGDRCRVAHERGPRRSAGEALPARAIRFGRDRTASVGPTLWGETRHGGSDPRAARCIRAEPRPSPALRGARGPRARCFLTESGVYGPAPI
jgi:hypothetical protein